MPEREFSIEEANALVPELHRIVSSQMLVQDEVTETLSILHARLGRLPRDITVLPDDDEDTAALKRKMMELAVRLNEGWNKVAELGGQVKDQRIGLVDFPGRVNGELVCLCWRFGEEAITHYHGLDEGFAGRKPLPEAPVRHRLLS